MQLSFKTTEVIFYYMNLCFFLLKEEFMTFTELFFKKRTWATRAQTRVVSVYDKILAYFPIGRTNGLSNTWLKCQY